MKRAACCLFLLAGCPSEESEPTETAPAANPRRMEAPDLGVHVSLPHGWMTEQTERSGATGKGPTVTAPGTAVRTVAKAHRVPSGRPFLVAPRVVITVEPTARVSPPEIFAATKRDLEALDERRNVTVTKTGLRSKFIGPVQVGEIDAAYEVKAQGGERRKVIHRSVVILRRPKQGSRAIVTITATYLANDENVVSKEIEAILNSLVLTEEK